MKKWNGIGMAALLMLACSTGVQSAEENSSGVASVFAAPRERPSLFITAEELPALREKLKSEPFAERWERFIKYADHILEQPTRHPGPWLNHSRPALGYIGVSALAYLVTGERRYGERAKEELEAMIEVEQWTGGFFLVVGERSAAAALAYDWCYDLFTPEERERYAEAIVRLGVKPYFSGKWWGVEVPVTNWRGVGHGGCGLAALALADKSEVAAKAAEWSWGHNHAFLEQALHEDGGGPEGIMYWNYGVTFSLYYLAAATRLCGGDDGLSRTLTERLAGYWNIYMHGPDQRYANFNNMNEGTFAGLYGENEGNPMGGPPAATAALFESWVDGGDPLLLWAADNGGHAFYFWGGSPFWFLWRRPVPPAGPKPELQPNVLFRGAGHAILSSPRLWFAMHGGWNNTQAHYNLDLGTFILVADGERLVHDPGYKFIATADHSTLVFGGDHQSKGPRGKYLRFGEGEGFSYAACDLSGANVAGPTLKRETAPERPVERWVRHAVLVDDAFIVLMDDVKLSDACDVEWRLQSRLPIEAGSDGRSATVRGEKNALRVVAVRPKDATVVAEEREAKKNPGDPKGVPVHTLSIRAANPELETRYLVVLYPQSPDGGAPPQVTADSAGKLTVVAGDRRNTLVFERGNGGWVLAAVNGRSAADIPSGEERSLRRILPHGDASGTRE